MLSALRLGAARRRPATLTNIQRLFATETSISRSSTQENEESEESEEKQRQRYEEFLAQKAQEPPSRPQLNVKVSPNHGLYAFFRQVPVDGGSSYTYETVESNNKPEAQLGRGWNAQELRRKSFKDLHTLWYIVLRERNVLATQFAESKRLGIMKESMDVAENDRRCRKTMARIKQILNERRLAYEKAYALEFLRIKGAEAARAKNAGNAEEISEDIAEARTQAPTRGRRRRITRSGTRTAAVA